MYQGSCLCGAIKFEIHDAIHDIVCCHCSRCRKAQGSAFATNGNVAAERFHFIQGENEMTAYEAAPGEFKDFCKHCGSPVMKTDRSKPDIVRIRLGLIESVIAERPSAHIFTGSKADWEEIGGKLPQFEETIT